jgi:2-iminobutanoate/2-iminopropanoate deaminase
MGRWRSVLNIIKLFLIIFLLLNCTKNSERQIILTDKAPKAIGPYSQAVLIDNTIYVAGQIAINPSTGKLLDGDITEQTNRVMKNIQAILNSAGFKLDDIVQCQIYLSDLSHYSEMNKVYSKYFNGNYPARAVVEVKRIPRNALIEIIVTAQRVD